MLDKLLGVLPYNPSIVHQLSFYSRRMREESHIRRIGLVFIVLAFMVQFVAVIAPPTSTSADSSNDLINGGFGTTDGATAIKNAKADCDQNLQHYKDILNYYGVSCDNVANSTVTTLKSTDTATFGTGASKHTDKLYSMGHISYGAVNKATGKTTGEVCYGTAGQNPDNHPPGAGVCVRYLDSFDTAGASTYQALKVANPSNGKQFYLLFNCGNIATFGIPTQATGTLVATNPAAPVVALPPVAAPPTPTPAPVAPTYTCPVAGSTSNIGDAACTHTCPDVPSPVQYQTACPAVCATDSTVLSGTPTCYGPCYPGSTILADSPSCKLCPGKTDVLITDTGCTKVCPAVTSPVQYGTTCPELCPYDQTVLQSDKLNCKPCTASLSSQDTLACVARSKVAADLTSGAKTDGNGSMNASPNDVITYTLYAKNNGKTTVKDFVFQDNISDTLDYATVDTADGGYHGGSAGTGDESDLITWPTVDIKAGETASVQLTIKVLGTIPATPTSTSDPGHFDLIMTNVFGNATNITVPAPPVKAIEVAATTKLVNTGPGTGLFLGAIAVMAAGYFYFRSRLLAVESTIAVHENTTGGL